MEGTLANLIPGSMKASIHEKQAKPLEEKEAS